MIKKGFLIFLAMTCHSAFAGTASVPNTFVAGQKAVAQDMNDNFSALTNFINGPNIASENITSLGIATVNLANQAVTGSKIANNTIIDQNVQVGGLTHASIATTDGSYLYNRRYGCKILRSTVKVIQVYPPCDIVMDGTRGNITATQDVSLLTATEDAATVQNGYNYVYGTPSNGGLNFFISPNAPNESNQRKSSGTSFNSRRYIGSFRTGVATIDIVGFNHGARLNEYHLSSDIFTSFTPQVITVNSTVAANKTVDVPGIASSAMFYLSASITGTGQCILEVDPGGGDYFYHQITQDTTFGSTPFDTVLFPGIQVFNSLLINAKKIGTNCTNVTLSTQGYVEPDIYYY